MIEKSHNIFEQATQLISLDCSSIIGETATIYNTSSQYLHQSLLNLKTVLPTFTSQFESFKEEMIQMSYFIVNKLMSVIKTKSIEIIDLKEELLKSQSLTNSMKKQVIQLRQMISEFMDSYKKQIERKDKEMGFKEKQIQQLKTLLKENINDSRSLCKQCQSKISQSIIVSNVETIRNEQMKQQDLGISNFFKNYNNKEEILIEMSESIVCKSFSNEKKTSLEIIQEEGSDINSLTDYLYSQRNGSKQTTQSQRSSRSIGNVLKQKDQVSADNGFECKTKHNKLEPTSLNNLSQCDRTIKGHSPTCKVVIPENSSNFYERNTFSSRTNKNAYQNKENQNPCKQRQRRCSEQLITDKPYYQDFKLQRKPLERNILLSKPVENMRIQAKGNNDEITLKTQLEQISKSSSSTDLQHLGDTDKININQPKKFDSPKKMNFAKKFSSKKQQKSQRLKTQPSPRNCELELGKENINLAFYSKPVEIGKKIFAKKKMIMTHAKASHTSRIQSKNNEVFKDKEVELKQLNQACKSKLISIKYIQSPQRQPSKSSHLFKPSISNMFSSHSMVCEPLRHNNYIDTSNNSNISNINDSSVKSHHMYHSTGKHNLEETPKNGLRSSMTPKKFSGLKPEERRCFSKSKEKLKIVSKSNFSSGEFSSQQKKQKFLNEMNQQSYTSLTSQAFNSKLKNKNLSVHICGSKLHLKQNLLQIKQSFKAYQLDQYVSGMREVFYDKNCNNDLKYGFGKIVYDNGIVYEGQIKQHYRHGEGKLALNGVDVFEGKFVEDRLQGQGYLKFLKYLSNPSFCPKPLQNASYFGGFSQNKFDGMGTIFLSQKEKIVTKFCKGVPFGQLTFYTEDDIQFGHWPTD